MHRRHEDPEGADLWGLDAETVFQMLDLLARQTANPRFVAKLDISRRDAVRTAISLWGGGALRERTKLRPLPRR